MSNQKITYYTKRYSQYGFTSWVAETWINGELARGYGGTQEDAHQNLELVISMMNQGDGHEKAD